MLRKLLFLSVVFGAAFASRSANQYIDTVIRNGLPTATRELGLDPLKLSTFSTRFGPTSVYQSQGEATFTNGNATGLAKLQRVGDCSGPSTYRGELSINCTLRIYHINLSYQVTARNGTRYYPARAGGFVQETTLNLEIVGRPQSHVGSVKNFRLVKLGMVNPTVNGLPVSLNTYLKVMFDAYRTHVSSELFNVFQQKYAYALGRALAFTPMPR
ncbi:hypothetical protein X975_14306, partial [Stegodyphus mimosarum]